MNPQYRKIAYGVVISGAIVTAGILAEHAINRATIIPTAIPSQQVAAITTKDFKYLLESIKPIDIKGYKAIDFFDKESGERVTGFGDGNGLVALETLVSGVGWVHYLNMINSQELKEVMIGRNNGSVERISSQSNEWNFYNTEYKRLLQAAVASQKSKKPESLTDKLRNLL